MTRRRAAIGLGTLIVVSAVAAWLIGRGEDDGPTAAIVRGRIAQAIETTGVLEPVESLIARSMVSGRFAVVAVRPGDRVLPGDILAQLEAAPFQAAVAAAERAVVAAELAATLATERARSGSPADLGEALLAASRIADARAALTAAEADLAATMIFAPAAGTVLEVNAQAGAVYQAGAPLAIVNAGDRLQVAATLDEVDLPLVAVGTAVRVVIDAYPATEVAGTIVAIAPRGEPQGGGVTFAMTVAISPPTEIAARPGQSAAVTIPAITVDDALLVPAAAIESIGQRSFLHVLRDGQPVTVEIVPGLRSGGQVQIVSGEVREGERVRLPPR